MEAVVRRRHLVAVVLAVMCLWPVGQAATGGGGPGGVAADEPPASSGAAHPCHVQGHVPTEGCESWDYSYSTDETEWMEGTALSPDGGSFFLAGYSGAGTSSTTPSEGRMIVIGLDTESGVERWNTSYGGADIAADHHRADDVAVSPDGGTVFVAASIQTPEGEHRAIVQAKDADTGSTEWTVSPPSQAPSYTRAIAATDGAVIAAGSVDREDSSYLWTARLDPATGETIWYNITQPSRHVFTRSSLIEVDEPGNVLVGSVPFEDGWYRTAATSFDLSTGEIRWEHRTSSPDGAYPLSMDLGPAGDTLLLAGSDRSPGLSGDWHGRVEAVDADTGEPRWTRILFPGSPSLGDRDAPVEDIEIGPDGKRAYATGVDDRLSDRSYTAALDLGDGDLRWQETYTDYMYGILSRAIEVAPDGETVYTADCAWTTTTAIEDHVVTIARDADTGEAEWRARYNGEEDFGLCVGSPSGLAVGPSGDRLVAAGWGKAERFPSLPSFMVGAIAYELPPEPSLSPLPRK